MSIYKRKALFLDRDGVINIDNDYVYKQEGFHFLDGIFELVALAKQLDYMVIVITNQAGIGRGYYTEDDFHKLMDWVARQFECHDGRIDKVYFCPDHPVHGIGKYHRNSHFRKPGSGMILQAEEELNINLQQSILVGDKTSDIEAGLAAGIGTLLLLENVNKMESATSITHLIEVKKYLLSERQFIS